MDRTTLIGLANPLAPPIVLSSDGERAFGEVTFTAPFEGAPGLVHGGMVAAAFDQVFGYLGMVRNLPALTGSLEVRYRRPTPLEVPLRFEARVERVEGKKSFLSARCLAGDELCAEAEALFVILAADRFNALMEARP
jgi:acyl-coenzyme A thioesterase PaaI-like protein